MVRVSVTLVRPEFRIPPTLVPPWLPVITLSVIVMSETPVMYIAPLPDT
jgi:hypothetical protein